MTELKNVNRFSRNDMFYFTGLIFLFVGITAVFSLGVALIVLGAVLIVMGTATSFFVTWLSIKSKENK